MRVRHFVVGIALLALAIAGCRSTQPAVALQLEQDAPFDVMPGQSMQFTCKRSSTDSILLVLRVASGTGRLIVRHNDRMGQPLPDFVRRFSLPTEGGVHPDGCIFCGYPVGATIEATTESKGTLVIGYAK